MTTRYPAAATAQWFARGSGIGESVIQDASVPFAREPPESGFANVSAPGASAGASGRPASVPPSAPPSADWSAPEHAQRMAAMGKTLAPWERALRSLANRAPIHAVLAQIRAHVVPLHPALTRHLAHVALGSLGEPDEVVALEGRDRHALRFSEGGLRLRPGVAGRAG